jgi:hypothetical protein
MPVKIHHQGHTGPLDVPHHKVAAPIAHGPIAAPAHPIHLAHDTGVRAAEGELPVAVDVGGVELPPHKGKGATPQSEGGSGTTGTAKRKR